MRIVKSPVSGPNFTSRLLVTSCILNIQSRANLAMTRACILVGSALYEKGKEEGMIAMSLRSVDNQGNFFAKLVIYTHQEGP